MIAERRRFHRLNFNKKFVQPNRPVVYRGYAANWRAVKRWDPEFLSRDCGSIEIPLYDLADQTIRLKDFVDLLRSGERAPYIRNVWLLRSLPQLASDVRVPAVAEPNRLSHPAVRAFIPALWNPWFEFFFSGPHTRFSRIHADAHSTHAWVVQIHGRKRFWMWPGAVRSGASLDVSEGQDIDSIFTGHQPETAVLDAGDLLFIPSGWWHTAESQTASISLSGNFVNDTNWEAFFRSYFLEGGDFSSDVFGLYSAIYESVTARLSHP